MASYPGNDEIFYGSLSQPSGHVKAENIQKTPNEEKSKTNYDTFSKRNHLLQLNKSQLSLYNEGIDVGCNKGKLDRKIDFLFSELDNALPSDLENWVDKGEAEADKLLHGGSNEQDVDVEYILALPTISDESEVSEFELRGTCKSSLDKICGLAEAKNELKSMFIYPILYPRFFPENIRTNQVLLYGPPGTGKSLLAKAVADELNAVLFRVSSGDFMSHWQGETEKQIREIFEAARSVEAPVVLFFDEIDGLCRSRTSAESDITRRIKTELLLHFESDANDDRQNSVYLVAATNCPWEIDSAFLRRFHKRIYIPLPDKVARIEILKRGFAEVETELTDEEWESAGNLTEGYSGSDLINIVMGSCSERLIYMMNCQYWESNGKFWIPSVPDSLCSISRNFEDLPRHQIHCRPIQISDLRASVLKTPKSVSDAELRKFQEYAGKRN